MQIENCTSAVMSLKKGCGAERVLILGLGNILLKDEGVGVYVVEQLQKLSLPNNVEVMDGGTASLDILLLQQGIDKLVVIDAMKAGSKPCTVFKARFEAHERGKLERIFSRGSKISLHQIGLIDALAAAEKLNCAPKEIVIIGAEPKEIDWGLELTDQVKQRVPDIINSVLEEI